MTKMIEYQCPDCGHMNETDMHSVQHPICTNCHEFWDWDDLDGFHNCKSCHQAFESMVPGYCSDCMDYERHLQDLWEDFMRIPGTDDALPANFDRWEAGTSRGKIWEWFEEQAPRGIHFVMYTTKEELDDYEANS